MDIGYHFTPWMVDLLKIAGAYILAVPTGWDREQDTHSVGVRTFPLVAMASCAYLLADGTTDANSRSRVLQGLVTGIGFLGAGAILKEQLQVRGTATAAAIWSTAAMGAAMAQGLYHIAIFLAVMGFATLRYLQPVKNRINQEPK